MAELRTLRAEGTRLASRSAAQRRWIVLLIWAITVRRLPGGQTRKELASSLASGPSLGYLVPYERIELLGSDTTATGIFSEAERPG